jgi:hypothetical protein
MAPPAPALFSTTTACPQAVLSALATRRAEESDGPAAGVGTMRVTVRFGKGAADWAAAASGRPASKARAVRLKDRRVVFMVRVLCLAARWVKGALMVGTRRRPRIVHRSR